MSEYLDGYPEDPDDPAPLAWANVSGWNARGDGLPLKENPFRPGSPMARAWEKGWRERNREKAP
jgi:hypothetical protein